MKKTLFMAMLLIASASAFATTSLTAEPLSFGDPIVPIVNGDSDVQVRAGLLYYDIGVGLKIIDPTGNVETLSSAGAAPVTSEGTSERIERIKFYGASPGIACTGTCTVVSSLSASNVSITRNSLGVYTIGFQIGIWSAAPTCTFSLFDGTFYGVGAPSNSPVPTATSYKFNSGRADISGTGLDVYGDIICMGPK